MKQRDLYRGSALTVVFLMIISGAAVSNADPVPTRAVEESIWITATVDLNGFSSYIVEIDLEIFALTVGDETFNTTQMRALYGSFPDNTTDMIDNEIQGRAINLTSSSFTGDDHRVVQGELDVDSLDGSLSGNDPVSYHMLISGNVSMERFMSPALMERVDPERTDIFITGMLLSGFQFDRTVSLRANIGEKVTYRIPDTFDPLGDGVIPVRLVSSDEAVNGYHEIKVDGGSGEFLKHFTFTMKAENEVEPVEERILGNILIDWFRLDRVGIRGELEILSMAITRTDAFDELPMSIRMPGFISPGFIRFADVEGVLLHEDVRMIEEEASAEMEQSLRGAIQGSGFTVSSELVLDTDAISHPGGGDEVTSIISNTEPLVINVETEEAMELDILEGYEHDDVMGLLHGGLRIRRELDQVTDDRLNVTIMLPENLIFTGHSPVEEVGFRNVYLYSGGIKEVGSRLAEHYEEERIALDAEIDLSDVSSRYLSDMEISVEMDAAINMHRIAYSPGDFELETDLDHSLDFISSDLLRLFLKMGIIEEEDVENEIRGEIDGLIEDLLDEEGYSVDIRISNDTLVFDGNINEMDDFTPVEIMIRAMGKTLPLGDTDSTSNAYENRFIPFHLDPILPVRGIEKTIDTGAIEGWETNLKVIFPSGFGVSAWSGENENDRVKKLEIVQENGFPALVTGPGDLTGDHILLELEIGPYFAYNNVTACFCSATGLLALVVLLIVVLIIRGIARKRRKGSDGGMDGEAKNDDSEPDVGDEDGKKLKW